MILSKKVFWFLSLTWGLPMTLLGIVAAIGLMLLGFFPKKNIYGLYFEVGEDWGGLDLGPICIVNKNPTQHILNHEFGHAVQNCFFGFFMPLIVCLPSALRYWYREFQSKKNIELPPYDSAWFEGQATEIGANYFHLT